MRQLNGVVGATIAGPYLAAFLLSLLIMFREHDNLYRLLETDFYAYLFFLGTIGLLYTCIPTLILSLVAAMILRLLRWNPFAKALIAGSSIGLCFGAFLSASDFSSNWYLIAIFLLSGALCGWIYWFIAIGRTHEPGHAIAKP
ncbi:hypothetical protein DC522_10470 [Microvirga sp. KLBC 81]|uniref:hypothetical protein n=1 Tax=Microvirga sp. KLBC 81 TaxID=1862707 RepID=UPI000D5234B0|nr:hypothetical protein [Microvirga sp. KLBC 81]PVE24501.1 hypothetical protein DC522_10470 [Microvirga sp. KLBC 81]